jgi:hypothetical protein
MGIPIYNSSDVVRVFVADVNGHPRTLLALRDILRGEKYLHGFKPTRAVLLADLRARLGIQESDFQVPAQVIVNALMQQPVHSQSLTEPGGLPYSYYIAMVGLRVCAPEQVERLDRHSIFPFGSLMLFLTGNSARVKRRCPRSIIRASTVARDSAADH